METEETNEPAAETPEEPSAPADEPAAEPAASAESSEAATEAEPDGDTPPAEEPKAAAPKPRVRRRTAKPAAEKPRARAAQPKRTRAAAKTAARKPIVRLPKPERQRAKAKERRGVVVSNAMDKTIVVRVETVRPHPMYKKVLRRSTKLHAHDPENRANVGDLVRVVETRPLSKTKAWRLAEILQAAK